MPNNIPAEQNSMESLALLRASRQVYDDAKLIGTIQLVLSVTAAAGGPLLAAVLPAAKVWSAIYGGAALLIDLIFLEPAAKRRQEAGAKIQERFDTRLYGLAWSQVKAGAPPDHETVVELARRHEQRHPDPKPLQDWYPVDVGRVPMEYARFVCQRANMRWDSSLRKNFCVVYLVLLVALWVAGAGYAVTMGYSTEQFVLSLAVPLLPASVQLWRERAKQADSARDSERAKEHLEGLWRRAVAGAVPPEKMAEEARLLQDELYDRRRRSPGVWQIFRERLR
jgi:hypothetical protein